MDSAYLTELLERVTPGEISTFCLSRTWRVMFSGNGRPTMTDLTLFDGCYVILADGSVCGPVRTAFEHAWFASQFWHKDTGKDRRTCGTADVTSVHSSLSELAEAVKK